MLQNKPHIIQHRNNGQSAAVIFVHGFNGSPGKGTWGEFPNFLATNSALSNWDIFSLGYTSRLSIDFKGFWTANPDIPKLALYLYTCCTNPPLNRYKSLALVAHSMGGLVVQQALVDYDLLTNIVSHIFLFGTPTFGLSKASPFRLLNRQVRDLARDSQFITNLRQQWVIKFAKHLPFKVWSVAGDVDEFVPERSSLAPFRKKFPEVHLAVVPGNHLEMIKPESDQNLSVQLVFQGLQGKAGVSGLWSGAAVAIESRNFRKAIRLLEPNQEALDPDAVVQLALALESTGRSDDALTLLEKHQHCSTDAMGVLAGRLKRRWLVERRSTDGRRAKELYEEAFHMAEQAGDHEQAFYHGINIAFIDLASGQNRSEAKARASVMAEQVLEHCRQASLGKWRYATEAEAMLMLGKQTEALIGYRAYIAASPTPRELESTWTQAKKVADLMGATTVYDQLDEIFLGNKSS